MKVYNTNVELKRKYWPVFEQMIRNQFEHGGEKYALEGQPDKESTDWLCELSPGKTGFDWIFQTIGKYCARFINFQREKDLLKIATYAYIAWLKAGYHLGEHHDEGIGKDEQELGIPFATYNGPEGMVIKGKGERR